MGFTYALHWSQQAHLGILEQAGVLDRSKLLFDFLPAPASDSRCSSIVYVDNGIYMSSKPGVSEQTRKLAQDALERRGLPIHDIESDQSSIACLGLQLDPSGCGSTRTRRWKLMQAITHVLEHPRITGEELEILVGHLTFCFVLRRPCLAIFRLAMFTCAGTIRLGEEPGAVC